MEAGCTYGWRIGELLFLKVDQVDFDNWTIRLHPGSTKNKDGREVTMTRSVYDIFARLAVGKSGSNFLFIRADGKAVKDFRETWKKARAAAGAPGLLFHDLRRTAARNFRRAGAPDSVIMKMGGWRRRSVFDRYAIASQTDIQDALQKLEHQRNYWIQKNAKNQEQYVT